VPAHVVDVPAPFVAAPGLPITRVLGFKDFKCRWNQPLYLGLLLILSFQFLSPLFNQTAQRLCPLPFLVSMLLKFDELSLPPILSRYLMTQTTLLHFLVYSAPSNLGHLELHLFHNLLIFKGCQLSDDLFLELLFRPVN
jgi:hypothetical protein